MQVLLTGLSTIVSCCSVFNHSSVKRGEYVGIIWEVYTPILEEKIFTTFEKMNTSK